MYAIHVDWGYNNSETGESRWEFIGRYLLSEKEQDDDPDAGIPMMNFAYPLECEPTREQIREVMDKTNCTVVQDNESGTYYLALTGGGMDLSQDIAYAYMLTDKWIPYDLLRIISTQPELSIHGAKWLKLAREVRRQLRGIENDADYRRKEWAKSIKDYGLIAKERQARRAKEAIKAH